MIAPETPVRVRQTSEESQRTWEMAINYQNSLTKQGKPRKR